MMAEPTAAADGDEDGKFQHENDSAAKRKVARQPNRRQHERDVQALTEQISAKEVELRSLGRPNADISRAETEEKEQLLKEQNQTKELREKAITKRKEYDDHIHKISGVISKMSDEVSKIKANIPYKTDREVDDAIYRLEYQLQTQHFKLRDEKRIVNEITKLKRSKKQVQQYQAKRAEVESEIRKKEEMKGQRKKYFRQVSELKTKEDGIRQKLQRIKGKTDEAWNRYREAGPLRERLKKDIDGLFEMRRQLQAEFQTLMREFKESMELQRLENERRKDEERKALEANHRREWFEYESSREPFQDERRLIEGLVNYLHKLLPKGEGQAPSDGGSPQNGASPVTSVSSASSVQRRSSFKDEEGTFTILRKKADEDDEVFLQVVSNKKKKGRRKSWMNKPLRHSRVIFNQFASVNLSAPSSVLEITEVLGKLRTKLQYYEDAAASVKMAHSAIPHDISSTSSVSSGIVTATDVEDNLDSMDELLLESSEFDSSLSCAGADVQQSDAHARWNDSTERSGSALIGAHGADEVGQAFPSRAAGVRNSSSSTVSEMTGAGPGSAAGSLRAGGKVQGESLQRFPGGTDECASSGSDDGKETGNVTDDSESTVVANEGESGQSSTSEGSGPGREPPGFKSGDVLSNKLPGDEVKTQSLSRSEPSLEREDCEHESDTIFTPDSNIQDYDSIDKDREDSGMVDVQDGNSGKGGLVERKNENLRLIMSRREKDVEPARSDLSSSQVEYSSDYASNSTGSAVSTPTDVLLPQLKKEPPLVDSNPTIGKHLCHPDLIFATSVDVDQGGDLNVNNNSSTMTAQQALELSTGALRTPSLHINVNAVSESEHLNVFQKEDSSNFFLPSTHL